MSKSVAVNTINGSREMTDHPSKLRRIVPWLFGLGAILLVTTLYVVNETSWFDEPKLKCDRINAEDARRIAYQHIYLDPSIHSRGGYPTFEEFRVAMKQCDGCVKISDLAISPMRTIRQDTWSVSFSFPRAKGTFEAGLVIDRCGKIKEVLQG